MRLFLLQLPSFLLFQYFATAQRSLDLLFSISSSLEQKNCLICHLDFDLLIKHFFMIFECVFQEGPAHLPVGIITFWKSAVNFVFNPLLFTMLLWDYQKLP